MPALLGPSLCLGCLGGSPSCFGHWWCSWLKRDDSSSVGSDIAEKIYIPKARLVSKRAVCICLCYLCTGRFNSLPSYLYTSHSRFFLIDSCIVEITLKEEPFLFTHRTYIWMEPKFPIKPTHPTSMRFSEKKKHPSAKAFASAILAIFAVSLDWWSETSGKGRGFLELEGSLTWILDDASTSFFFGGLEWTLVTCPKTTWQMVILELEWYSGKKKVVVLFTWMVRRV